ncbi:MAG: ribosome-associated translation inhibitor RaiA [Bdellovibrionota bacterium]
MKVTISFKHLEHTPAIDEKIREKSAHLEKYLEGDVQVKWTCSIEEPGHPSNHVAEIQIHGPKYNFHATACSENLYKCLDLVVEKMEKQLSKHKEKWKNRLHEAKHEVVIHDPEEAWNSCPDAAWGDFKKVI